jgi:predicted nucleic acid-binding protein
MELLSLADLTSDVEIKIRDFLGNLIIVPITETIEEKAIFLRKNHRLKLPDAVIASTALIHDLILITADRKIFSANIPNLILVNPRE